MKKYFYIFQVYKGEKDGILSDLTTVEFVASDHAAAEKELPKVLQKNDRRQFRLASIVAIDGKEKH